MGNKIYHFFFKSLRGILFLFHAGCGFKTRSEFYQDLGSKTSSLTEPYNDIAWKNIGYELDKKGVVTLSRSPKEWRNFFIKSGISKKVLDRIKNDDWKLILDDSKGKKIIVDALKLATCLQILYNYAKNQFNVDFERGSFSIQDENDKFFQLFKETSESSESYFYNRDPTCRKSSHYTDSPDQYGVDIVLDKKSYPVELLPFGHHILFGSVKKLSNHKATFVKCEHYGLHTWIDYFNHGIEFAHIMMEPSSSSASKHHREKDLPAPICELKDQLLELTKLSGLVQSINERKLTESDKRYFSRFDRVIGKINDLKKVHNIIYITEFIKEEQKRINKSSHLTNKSNLLNLYQKLLNRINRKIAKLQGGRALLHIRTGNECVVPQDITNQLIKVLTMDISLEKQDAFPQPIFFGKFDKLSSNRSV